jgi:hypothetical protein
LEARGGIEPPNKGFADLCLTTWLPRRCLGVLFETYHNPAGVNGKAVPLFLMNLRRCSDQILRFLSQPSNHTLVESVFLRLLGLTYIAAFGSLWFQAIGLFGSHGIVPVVQVLPAMRSQFGSSIYLSMPSLFWLRISDRLLLAACALGCTAAVLLMLGKWSRIANLTCWVLYLSFVSVGSPFMNFQWDALLLESGFLALFAGAPFLVWGYRFLLFRLMFESGLVKLMSGDPNWHNLHALRFHFMTQPLPNPVAYYAYRLPTWMLDGFTGATLVIELIVPFLFFGPRRIRYVAVGLTMLLQFMIILTGNYAFFNLLALALCLWGLDDSTFEPLGRFLKPPRTLPARVIGSAVVLVLIVLGALQVIQLFQPVVAGPLRAGLRFLAPFDIVNSYGLFAVMTTTRPEIILQGSNDQVEWRDYNFPYKPGELHRSLPLVAPYQPRLDWQMWFASLGSFQENTWVGNLMYRLLVGEVAVTKLLNAPPFPTPPRYMRASLYDYQFTTPAERERTGAIWKREFREAWFGPVSLTGR